MHQGPISNNFMTQIRLHHGARGPAGFPPAGLVTRGPGGAIQPRGIPVQKPNTNATVTAQILKIRRDWLTVSIFLLFQSHWRNLLVHRCFLSTQMRRRQIPRSTEYTMEPSGSFHLNGVAPPHFLKKTRWNDAISCL